MDTIEHVTYVRIICVRVSAPERIEPRRYRAAIERVFDQLHARRDLTQNSYLDDAPSLEGVFVIEFLDETPIREAEIWGNRIRTMVSEELFGHKLVTTAG